MAKYYPVGRPTLHMLGKIKPVKKNRKSTFNQLTAAVKHRCKELEIYRILNYEINQTY
jgi:hypothetical protein